ncbi:glycosyl transferase, group 1 [Oceaniovalibus guishaninsula JLT2003]|uniref:Glycosyl transferase, group 1 n=1 Tax=Oceaniovalibus guishaninsula JLT2003 TaxID=1231392 RepID=K2H9K9_9RHOB|nr:glycosyltransferase [Oceaniovalibus guishaninsula]EKE43307.1 glycosyl transferase, group 1 [Oceaniovalibus guishaninsula JLT2003]
MNILFFQYGDFAQAHASLAQGLPETYRDQARSVRLIEGLSDGAHVTVANFCDTPYDVALSPALRVIGLRVAETGQSDIAAIFAQAAPDRVICRSPNWRVLKQARREGIATLPCFASIFSRSGLQGFRTNRRFRHGLSGANVPCVANHSLNASRSLADVLGIAPERIVPWDWTRIPMSGGPKTAPADPLRPTAFYAGTLSESKGVGDCLKAVRLLKDRGIALTMSFAGTGPDGIETWQDRARTDGIADRVRFLGRVPQSDVRAGMRSHDLVVVPSRHDYAEGFPNTILEGLASASPVIVSDHPAFRGRLEPDRDCLVFRAGDAGALADCIDRAMRDRTLYETLSRTAGDSLERVHFGMDWGDLIATFLNDPHDEGGWVARNSLRALGG